MRQRAMFYERDDAERVAGRLTVDGFDVEVVRERFAGEDDDEDHPWLVVTDAPEFVLEVLAEQYDGWLEPAQDEPPAGPPATAEPLDLPQAPKRVKNHFPRD